MGFYTLGLEINKQKLIALLFLPLIIVKNIEAIFIQLPFTGMYLGSAAAMYTLPSIVARFGPGALLKLVGAMGFSWTILWYCIGQDAPVR